MKNGFTIIEVLIAITISGVIALILTQLLSQSLQGGNKSDLLNNIQINGQSALSQIEADVHSSTQIICAVPTPTSPSDPDSALVLSENYGYRRYWIVPPSGGKNGYIEEDTLSDLSTPELTGGAACIVPTESGYIAGDPNSQQDVTNTDKDNGVSVLSGSGFDTTSESDGLIGVHLFLGAPVNAPAGFASQVPSAGVPFQTSVKVRCYNGDATCE